MTAGFVLEALPMHLRERVRQLSTDGPSSTGRYVLYWMHHAGRGHENPALDTALSVALDLDLPLLVYQGLGGSHRFSNDRHHTFILEGARDLRAELASRGISHALWLGEDPARPTPLTALARRAALVVTEEFPAPPFPAWTERLMSRASVPVWVVDTACVVPMRLVDAPFDRAFQFRRAVEALWRERLERRWIEIEEAPRAFDGERLPFTDVNFEISSVADLVARCEIDHSVGPVAHTPGGARAGYERWGRFRERGLRAYDRMRNDAVADGVSRLSPYLHHGHVSPLRIAREAASVGGRGAAKFLEELLVWRELAHNFCFHRHELVESMEALPSWARETLAAHADDPRQALSAEALARGRTGDRLWDLCQASLVRHGELHNNVRMTWGKAIPGWTESPETALATLIDLNHRFALDGSDPNSYGGLLWCLGLFDRPFSPGSPVLGTIRSRDTVSHARRLDLDRYEGRVLAPSTSRPLDVAVVGAGVAGLACARALADHGHRVRIFEKARGVGGRASTRRSDAGNFDHGAQYFTVRDERFRRCVESWRRDGVVREWCGTIAVLSGGVTERKAGKLERYVGVPGMSAVCAHLATDLEISLETRVHSCRRAGERWNLRSEDREDLGSYDALVVSAPAPQATELVAKASPALAESARSVRFDPCWAAMVAFRDPLDVEFDGAFVEGSAIGWVARNGSKPERPEGESWVLHASPDWSRENLEMEPGQASHRLLEEFSLLTGGLRQAPVELSAHRWRFARPIPLERRCLFDGERWIVLCGDWCGGPRIEGAFLSGCAAAGRVLALDPAPRQRTLFGESV